uniref:Protein kinase domain-containing protein n=1 Tax=Tetraodon nigroviridis TaxID=99883 RepID=H3BWM2_TETNG
MLANNDDLKVKLIDFGMAFQDSEVCPGIVVQPVPYRAPEVLLGLPFSYAIDMWGMGCVLMYLYLKEHLFTVCSEFKMISQVVKLLGQPEDHLLAKGLYTRKYFVEVNRPYGPAWRLKTPEEYNLDAPEKIVGNTEEPLLHSLDDLVNIHKFTSSAEYEDQLQFLDLIKSLLNVNAAKRISASEALNHPFITMSHLLNPEFKYYLKNSTQIMSCCKKLDSTVDGHSDAGSEEQQKADNMERQPYESLKCQQSGGGKHHTRSQEWEHLEGAQHQQPD